MSRIKINDLTKNKKLSVMDMLIGYTYKITYHTDDEYYVMVCYPSTVDIPYSKYSEQVVVCLDDGAIDVINDSVISSIEEVDVKLEITN